MTRDGKRAQLKRGWTTGACAAAAAGAAWTGLTTGRFPDPVSVRLPGGETPAFPLAHTALSAEAATAGVVKDAGDDPDITHGAEIRATVRRGPPGSGVVFRAGPGVGTVTRPGLPLAVGEPAINPVPRDMIRAAVGPDAEVTVSVPGGEALARRTLNPRLGIEGGLSILGTTGIVVPYSCSAWIESIRRGVDVAVASGLDHVAAATGRTSERAVQQALDLPDAALIEMGDFAGGLLKYLRDHPVGRLTLAGGFAKLSKLAQGYGNLHSGRASVDVPALAALLADLGGPAADGAGTAAEVLDRAGDRAPALAAAVAAQARRAALDRLDPRTAVDVMVFDRKGALLAHARD